MNLNGNFKCNTCGKWQYKIIKIDCNCLIDKTEFEWKCEECGFLNYAEIKVKED